MSGFQILTFASQQALDTAANVLAGATLSFSLTGTNAPTNAYANSALTIALANPLSADSGGAFVPVFLDPTIVYRVVLKTLSGVVLKTWDPANENVLASIDSQFISSTLDSLKRTAGEIAVEVTPSNYAYDPYTSPRYTVVGDNATNDYAKLRDLLAAAVAATDVGGSTQARLTTTGLAVGTIRCDTALSYDCSRVQLDGGGCYLNFENHVNAAFSAIKLTTGEQSAPLGIFKHNTHPLENIIIQMPDRDTVNNGEAIRIEDIVDDGSGNYVMACASLRNISIHGGAFGLVLGNGVWGANIFSFCATSQGTNSLGVGIYAPDPFTDGQEASKVFGGLISNCRSAVTMRRGSLYLFGLNYDGCENIGTLENEGRLLFSSSYGEAIEGNNTQYKFDANDSNARIEIVDFELNVRSDLLAARTKYFGRNAGRVYIRNLHLFIGTGPATYFAQPFLFEGVGRVRARDITYTGLSPVPLVQKGFNWCAYPDCTNANVLAAFALTNSGASSPVRVSPVLARDVVRFAVPNAAASGSFSRAVMTHACSPGQRICATGEYEGNLAGSNVVAECTITYQDKGGFTIGTATTTTLPATVSGSYAVWMADGGYAPGGTETVLVQLQTRATGTVVGNTQYHMSPLDIGDAGSCG